MKKVICIILILSAVLLCSCSALKKLYNALTKPAATTGVYVTLPETEEEQPVNAVFSPRIPDGGMPYYDTCARYAWTTLDAEGKELYYDVLEAALSYKPSVEIPSDRAALVYECVFFDTPELFYLDEKPEISDGKLTFRYAFTEEEARNNASRLDGEYDVFKASLDPAAGEYEKLQYLYEYIINRTKYDREAEADFDKNVYNERVYRASSAVGPLADCRSICIGYARATQYLCLRLGIQTFTVRGSGIPDGIHYFSLVLLDDGYYYVDTTWGDPVGSDPSTDYLTYNYFCITTEELLRSHQINMNVPLPVCTNEKYNYFVYNKLTAKNAAEAAELAYKIYETGADEARIKVDPSILDETFNSVDSELLRVFRSHGVEISVRKTRSRGPSLIVLFFDQKNSLFHFYYLIVIPITLAFIASSVRL